mgnify:CR=1 FL=1
MDRDLTKKTLFLIATITVALVAIFSVVQAIQPNGGSTTVIRTETAPADTAGNHSAYAGNLTELTIAGFATTQSWQGYFGNVSGAIELSDASGDIIYNWSLSSPQGEVYSSTNSTITWTNIQCFNFTANGTGGSSGETAGATNLKGTNLTVLETRFNIASDDVDGVNETFNFTQGADGHDAFFTANSQFSASECLMTHVYSPSGSTSNQFEEVLLFEPATSSVVFASLLEDSMSGYDNLAHDFEILVLEDGHSSDTSTTTYYFFVEIE